ncbi:MAG: DMT family transporter [Balneolales bacterium]
MKIPNWLFYASGVMIFWGVWGALIEFPEQSGFPAPLSFIAWAGTLVFVTIYAMTRINWKLDYDRTAIVCGMAAGLLGCGGQLILFNALIDSPAYIFFPIISLNPAVTIVLSVLIIKEKATRMAWFGIALALLAILLLTYEEPTGEVVTLADYMWVIRALIISAMWGTQGFIIKYASSVTREGSMEAESVTFYTMASALLLIPVALYMTDFSQSINWGLSGMYAAIAIQSLNAIGFLFFALSIRHGKAIIVVPMAHAFAPVITVILSLVIYVIFPHPFVLLGMLIAFIAIYLMTRGETEMQGDITDELVSPKEASK